ncbi:hypothetical protein Aperf_G00000022412 [Anoplocephala perfoliata]
MVPFAQSYDRMDLELELQHREEEVARRVVGSAQDIYGCLNGCDFCDPPSLVKDFERKRLGIWECYECGRRTCSNCCGYIGQRDSNDAIVICGLCQRKIKLIASSGAWIRRNSFESLELPIPLQRAHSYGDYLAHFNAKIVTPRWITNDKRLSSSKNTITNPLHHQDDPLPAITVESPKAQQFPDYLDNEETISPQSPLQAVKEFEGEEALQSNDSESPNTECMKSPFITTRIGLSPTDFSPKMTKTDNDHHPVYMDDLASAYYIDPWSYYDPEMIDVDKADEPLRDEERETFQLEDPPFEPISEEVEGEFAVLHQSVSNTSIATTTTTSDFHPSRSPFQWPISRHLSLERIDKSRVIPNNSFSFPLLAKLTDLERILLPKALKEARKFSQCETISPMRSGFHLDPVIEQGILRRVRVDNPPEIFEGIDLQTYAIANWSPASLADDENVRIIAGCEDEDDDDEGEEESEEVEGILGSREEPELPQMRRCQNFENINKLIATGIPLYPLIEEGSNGDSDPGSSSPALSDGNTIHRWGRRIPQQANSTMNIPSVTPYVEDQVLLKQEEQLWASLFAPSEQVVVESAKGFTAQLQEMSHLVEEVTVQADTQLSPSNVDETAREELQQSEENPSFEAG